MKTRWLLFLLCGCAAASAAGQAAPARPPLRPNPALFQMPTATASETVALPTLKMPDVLWSDPGTAASELRRILQRVPAFTGDGPLVVRQEPPPDAEVGPNTLISLTLGLPQLSVTPSTTTPAVEEDVTFEVRLQPPSEDVAYFFAWNDGSGETQTGRPEATHRFSGTGPYEVVVRAFAREMEIAPVITVISPFVPAPPDATGIAATGTTATEPPAAEAVAPSPTTAAEPVPPPPPGTTPVPPPPFPWLTIALIAAAVAAAALVRVVMRKPPAPSTPPPRVSIRSGLGAADYTIEHPEQIRNGLSLRLRGGVRSTVAGEGGADV